MTFEGDIPFFEAQVVSKLLRVRLFGYLRFGWVGILLAMAAFGAAIGVWQAAYGDHLPGVINAFVLCAFAVVLIFVFVWLTRRLNRAAQHRWLDRGVPEISHVAFHISDEALVVEAATATTRVPWAFVSELMIDSRYIIFIVAGMCYFVPRRLFADLGQERAFVASAFDKLGPVARGRSRVAATMSGAP